jgi:DNA-binding transcriptional ArsR family regulator
LTKEESTDILRGTTLKVYLFLLKRREPVGVREVQRALKLSSPSIAMYHLSKLEDAGLVKSEYGSYVVEKIVLENSVRISHFLVPRHLFYLTFAFIALTIQLTLFKPATLTREYFFSIITTSVLLLFLCYETIRTWLKGSP